jgi:hypothetical protein
MNTTETSGGFVFERGIIKNEDYSPLKKKESLKLLEGFCVWLPGILQKFALYFG